MTKGVYLYIEQEEKNDSLYLCKERKLCEPEDRGNHSCVFKVLELSKRKVYKMESVGEENGRHKLQ